MSRQRLRRRNDENHSLPIAAEVCETRALLSAGASAVHAAAAHAQAVKPDAHPLAADGFLTLNNGAPVAYFGTLTVTHLGQSVGSKFSATFQGHFSGGGQTRTVHITMAGKISQISGPANDQDFTVQRSGGSLSLKIQEPGSRPVHVKSAFSDSLFHLTVSNGFLEEIKHEYGFSASAPLPFSGGAMHVDILTE